MREDMGTLTAARDEQWRRFEDCFDKLKQKYGIGLSLDGELGPKRILSVFASVVTGQKNASKLLQMYSDEMMAEVLDEDDMAVWFAKKPEYLQSQQYTCLSGEKDTR